MPALPSKHGVPVIVVGCLVCQAVASHLESARDSTLMPALIAHCHLPCRATLEPPHAPLSVGNAGLSLLLLGHVTLAARGMPGCQGRMDGRLAFSVGACKLYGPRVRPCRGSKRGPEGRDWAIKGKRHIHMS